MPKWVIFVICVAVPMVVGYLSSVATGGESGGPWYQALEKPDFNPPSWVFGPVWTTLYFLMGVSLYLVYSAPRDTARRRALIAFGVQLVLNFIWSPIFFRFHMLGLASIEILLLLASIVVMIVLFIRVRPVAGYLQLPYLGWVSFATVLTLTIYLLNRIE